MKQTLHDLSYKLSNLKSQKMTEITDVLLPELKQYNSQQLENQSSSLDWGVALSHGNKAVLFCWPKFYSQ